MAKETHRSLTFTQREHCNEADVRFVDKRKTRWREKKLNACSKFDNLTTIARETKIFALKAIHISHIPNDRIEK
jgi:hypothetical protein